MKAAGLKSQRGRETLPRGGNVACLPPGDLEVFVGLAKLPISLKLHRSPEMTAVYDALSVESSDSFAKKILDVLPPFEGLGAGYHCLST